MENLQRQQNAQADKLKQATNDVAEHDMDSFASGDFVVRFLVAIFFF